jgi:hypothetical protein
MTVYCQWPIKILSQISSLKLEELELQLFLSSQDHYLLVQNSKWCSFDWTGVMYLLSDPKFTNLRRILVDCTKVVSDIIPHNIVDRRVDSEAERFIWERLFSGVDRHGILHFVHAEIMDYLR